MTIRNFQDLAMRDHGQEPDTPDVDHNHDVAGGHESVGAVDRSPPEELDHLEAQEPMPVLDASMLPEVVAELAVASEKQDHRLEAVMTTLTDLGHTIAQQADAVQDLRDGFSLLETHLSEKADMATPSRWAWPFLTQPEAEQLWFELRWFVDTLTTSCSLPGELSLPPCWYRHDIAVQELTGVYSAWREAYCGSDQPTAALTAFWDRWAWPALTRLSDAADWRECKQTRRHVEPTVRHTLTDNGFDQFVSDDVAARPLHRARSLPWSNTTSSEGERSIG